MNDKAFISWSGGKDSALALYCAKRQGIKVEALVTTVNKATDRISMHGVRRELLEAQAASIGLRLYVVELPEMPGVQAYEEALRNAHGGLAAEGFTQAVFGDIFLEDLRAYREELLFEDGLQAVFPIWKTDGRKLMQEFITTGFKAQVVCTAAAFLEKSFCGRPLDGAFVADLPPTVDPCGENGEYHSFVFDGPLFSKAVVFTKGETVYKEYPAPKTNDGCFTAPRPAAGFWFQDLLPA